MSIIMLLSFICNNVKLRFPLKKKIYLWTNYFFALFINFHGGFSSVKKALPLTAISPSLYYDYFWEFVLDFLL